MRADRTARVEDDRSARFVQVSRTEVGLKSQHRTFEFRRHERFHIDFLKRLGGVETDFRSTVEETGPAKELVASRGSMRVYRTVVRHKKDIQRADSSIT